MFFWVVYALCMMIYFSDDLFVQRVRRVSKAVGLLFPFLYPTLLIGSILVLAAYYLAFGDLVLYSSDPNIIPTSPAWQFSLYFLPLLVLLVVGIVLSIWFFFRRIVPVMRGRR